MPNIKRSLVLLEVHTEHPVEELALKIASRAYTIQGVVDCNVILEPKLEAGAYKFQTAPPPPVVEAPKPTTLWERIKGWFAT